MTFLTESINTCILGNASLKVICSYGRIDQFQRVSPACFSYIWIFYLRVKYKDRILIPQSHSPGKKKQKQKT